MTRREEHQAREALVRVLVLTGGPAGLARRLGVSRQAVSHWGGVVPAARLQEVSRAVGGAVSPQALRPDLEGVGVSDA
jgi:DNA-binding transcriptional regulator YdaS (Cro superfamily)